MFGQWLSHSHFRLQSSGFEFRHRQLVLNLFLLFAEETETKKDGRNGPVFNNKVVCFWLLQRKRQKITEDCTQMRK